MIKRFQVEFSYLIGNSGNVQYPVILQHLSILFKSPTGAKDMYNLVNTKDIHLNCVTKWSLDLGTGADKYKWKMIFKSCFKTTPDTSLIWLQYRILTKIIRTRELLSKMKIFDTDKCRLCEQEVENIVHLFCTCSKSSNLWIDIKS